MKIKYFSEITNRTYDTEEELIAAENEVKKQQERQENKEKERKEFEDKLDKAYDCMEEAYNNYVSKRDRYLTLKREYVSKYERRISLWDLLDNL